MRHAAGRGGLHYFRPDLPQFRTTLLVDSLYHVPPFIAACAGRSLDDELLLPKAFAMWRDHAQALSLPVDPSVSQLRSWFGTPPRLWLGTRKWLGDSRTARPDRILPSLTRPGRRQIEEFRRLASTILVLQDESGFWRTLLDDRESYLETSTAGFYGAVFTKGVASRLLPDAYGDAAERAWRALLSRIDDEGGAFGTSAATWAANAPVEDTGALQSRSNGGQCLGTGRSAKICGRAHPRRH